MSSEPFKLETPQIPLYYITWKIYTNHVTAAKKQASIKPLRYFSSAFLKKPLKGHAFKVELEAWHHTPPSHWWLLSGRNHNVAGRTSHRWTHLWKEPTTTISRHGIYQNLPSIHFPNWLRFPWGWPQLTHPPQFGTSGTATHWFLINTPLIGNIRVCDTVLMIGLLCVVILIRVSMGVSKLAKPVCCWCEMTSTKSHFNLLIAELRIIAY